MCLHVAVWQVFLVITDQVPHTHTLWVVLWEANHTWLIASVQTSVISCIVVWRLMIQHLECLSDYVTALHEKWNARPQQSNQLVNSMRSHCQAVINAQGHVRSYWDVDIFVVEYPLRLLAVWEEGITRSSAQICWIRPRGQSFLSIRFWRSSDPVI